MVKNRFIKLKNGYISGWVPTKDSVNMTTIFPYDFIGFETISLQGGIKDQYGNLQWKISDGKFIKDMQTPSLSQVIKKDFESNYPLIKQIYCLAKGIENGKNDPYFSKFYTSLINYYGVI